MADPKNGGLLGSLLLPKFADAGANDTFQKSPASTSQPQNEEEGGQHRQQGEDESHDHGSEAVTEVRDNRTAAKVEFRRNWKERQRTQAQDIAKNVAKQSTTPSRRKATKSSDDSDPASSAKVAGFFPSTKPHSTSLPSAANSSSAPTNTPNSSLNDTNATKAQQQPPSNPKEAGSSSTSSSSSSSSSSSPPASSATPKSPAPASPPSLFRRPLPVMRSSSLDAVSVAATSVVPQTGAVHFSQERLDALEEENRRRLALLEGESVPTLSAANLERFANGTDNDSTTDSSSGRPNREASLLAEEEREDGDRDTDDLDSDVGSTASEMGTVIQLGNHAARMAEIDAMAAMIEASPSVAQLTPRPDSLPPAPSQIPQHRTGPDAVSSLALPVLDSQPSGVPTIVQKNQLRVSATIESAEVTAGQSIHRMKPSTKASEMLTTAIRRIGSGLHKTKASLSAPPTPKTPGVPAPPPLEELLKSTLTPRSAKPYQQPLQPRIDEHQELPASLALRSPGSSARLSLRRNAQLRREREGGPRAFLAPRFSSTSSSGHGLSQSLSFDFPSSVGRKDGPSESLKNALPIFPTKLDSMSPFRMAQKAFSFDSILDGDGPPSVVQSTTDSQIIKLEASFPARRTEYEKTPMMTHMGIKESVSWDVGESSAFRDVPHRSFRVGGMQRTPSQEEFIQQRTRMNSDFSPSKLGKGFKTDTIVELQTPQRVMDVEREDALDILACLVERGVEGSQAQTKEDTSTNVESLVLALIDSLSKNVSATPSENDEKEEKDDEKGSKPEKQERCSQQIAALKEVLKSHSYAVEMKRASLSASSWLKSIGRSPVIPATATMTTASTDAFPVMPDPSDDDDDEELENAVPSLTLPTAVASRAAATAAAIVGANPNPGSPTRASSYCTPVDQKMQLLTLKARLHSAEQELREKSETTQKLNLELSKCRAEIGRLQIATRSELNQSRSMFDEQEDSTTGSAAPAGTNLETSKPEEAKLFDESFQGDNSLFQDVSILEEKNRSHESESLDVLVLKTALEQANETIRNLHKELHLKDGKDGEAKDPPVVAVPDTSLSGDKTSPSPKQPFSPGDEHRTVNVRMLDGENFVTEWDELTPLPPPPDHGIESPIVNVVLEQWTNDRGLHESLLAWMDRVMTGDDLESSVPPLTISSLDHQVRDGFTMHVLPLLLRRADIHVSVQMRAHRKTTYDLAVTVNQKVLSSNIETPVPQTQSSSSLLDQHHMYDEWQEKFEPLSSTRSVAHSAVTEAIVNSASRHNPQLRKDDDAVEYSHFGIPHPGSADAAEEAQQPTFMGALGGALGGLLSRNKYTPSQSPSRFFHDASISPTMRSVDLNSSPPSSVGPKPRPAELDDQPYHRVVSAPPGRIGVTFVEYRGHAMVSDVAPDSPLSSWVFPSDILIAVDEVPVSGMRVRDIIRVLTTRKDQQRALRVISSHAMNEFTLNQSAFADDLS